MIYIKLYVAILAFCQLCMFSSILPFGTLVRSDAVEKELPQTRFEKMMRKHLLLNR